MSSTNRGGQRSEADFYATPPWVTHRLLDEFEFHDPLHVVSGGWPNLPGGRWLEPCAGDGEIIRTVNSRRSDIVWSINELRSEMRPVLEGLPHEELVIGNALGLELEQFGGKKFDVAITNPPFRLAMPIVQKCMKLAKMTVMLLRLNFWGSDDRRDFMAAFPPQTLVIPNRPMFGLNKDGKPGTDSPEYAWMIWHDPDYYIEAEKRGRRVSAEIRVLRKTPFDERKAWTEHLKKGAGIPLLQTP